MLEETQQAETNLEMGSKVVEVEKEDLNSEVLENPYENMSQEQQPDVISEGVFGALNLA